MRTPKIADSQGKLSIGALSRATGIPVETLRTWERRYGFPIPERKPSGHRVYGQDDIQRLRKIAEAVARGHRASEVVPASEAALTALLNISPISPPSPGPTDATVLPAVPQTPEVADLLDAITQFDAGRLTRLLLTDWMRLGPLAFIHTRMAPLIREVGDAWAEGRLEIRHEHFLSERVGDILRSMRLPFEERASGPLVIFASLPGETHGLGLQMAALVLAVSGCRIVYLGTEVPESQVAQLAKERQARAVAISVSAANATAAMNTQLRQLRRLVPQRITILVGGDGAVPLHPKLTIMKSLVELGEWGQQLVGTAGF